MTNVGVLMALYRGDRADLFERALVSILVQELPAAHTLRVYLGIDGAIPAELEAVVQTYASRLHRISRSEVNVGLAATLNRLISLHEDEAFFFRMDADDVSLPLRFSAQLDYLRQHPDIDVLGTAIWECTCEGTRRLIRFASGPEDARRRIDRRVPVAHPTVCMRKRVLDAVGHYPDRRGNEDIAMWFACMEQGFKFDNLSEAYLEFTVNSGFWKRRSVEKAFSECRSYVEGIWRLDGFTWRYVFPLARLAIRLSPAWLSKQLYASRLRR